MSPNLCRRRLRCAGAGALLAASLACGRKPASNSAAPPGPAYLADPASRVNTLVGTTAGTNAFPGADFPFGMVQWSPDTSPDRPPGGGYEYNDTLLRGFSLTHISGPGCGIYGDIPILPMTGGLPAGDVSRQVQPFTHTGEIGTAGYYRVQSGSPAITTELTATLHGGMARFTFPATRNANLLIKLLDSQIVDVHSYAQVVSSTEVLGSATSGFFCGAPDEYTVYFDLTFDHPFAASQILDLPGTEDPSAIFLTFDTTSDPRIQAKAGISFVSASNARANGLADNPGWDFQAVRAAAHAAWNRFLQRIEIAGGEQGEQELFYTSLYHSLLHPNVFSDANGRYLGFDDQVHTLSPGQAAQYANYSGWDIYHSQVQLSALVAPRQMSDAAQSMLNDAAQNQGMLPKWALANGETYIMVGDPADGILAGYYAFGARAFDLQGALRDMLREATQPNPIRPGLHYYQTLGYLPEDGKYGCCNYYGSVATLLEYCQADFALAQFAAALGDSSDAAMLLARAQSWQNIFDPATGLFTPRLLDGSFVSGVGLTSTQGMVEGSASQYRWVLPFDRQALLTALGGALAVNPLLDSFFENLNDGSGTGALLSNEFELGVQDWYDASGEPWKTQEVVNRMRSLLYQDAPALIPNNDDLGALSSQLVWSMLGLYPDEPGSGILTLSGPEFPEERLQLPSGKALVIHAAQAAPSHPYIQSLAIGGQPSSALWLDPAVLQTGATLQFTMGSEPNTSWGSAPADAPPSFGMESTAAIGFSTPPGPIVVAPRGSAQIAVGAQSTRSDQPQSITWRHAGAASDGIALTLDSGQLDLPAGGRASQPLTVQGPAAQGSYRLDFRFTSSIGAAVPDLVLPLIVAEPGSLQPYFNNTGVSDDARAGAANFDGFGYSYSAQALAAAGVAPGGTLAVGGVSYRWPDAAAGQPDNIACGGQTLALASGPNQTLLGLLGSASGAGSGGAQAILTVGYADGSQQSIPITFSDWTLGGGGDSLAPGEAVAAKMGYRNAPGGREATTTYLFSVTAALGSSAAPVRLTLPAQTSGGQIHLFDVEVR